MSSDQELARASSTPLIAFVAQSPRLCAAHDRAGWCALFATDGQINDPVGSRPHQGHTAIGNFYDTFIAPNALSFSVENDVVCGMSVMRDLTLTSTMASGLAIPVPMHLRYDLVEEMGALKIRRLYAHWELPVLLLKQLGSLKGWLTALQLTPSLLRHQGFGGLLGFMRGLRGRGRAGKRTAEMFLAALQAGDQAGARPLLGERCEVALPFGRSRSLAELALELSGLRWSKVLAAGDYVTVTIRLGTRRGVARFRFDRPQRISRLEVFI